MKISLFLCPIICYGALAMATPFHLHDRRGDTPNSPVDPDNISHGWGLQGFDVDDCMQSEPNYDGHGSFVIAESTSWPCNTFRNVLDNLVISLPGMKVKSIAFKSVDQGVPKGVAAGNANDTTDYWILNCASDNNCGANGIAGTPALTFQDKLDGTWICYNNNGVSYSSYEVTADPTLNKVEPET